MTRETIAPDAGEVEQIARGMTPAQMRDLFAVCRTNGGGVRIACVVTDELETVPRAGPMRKLYDKALIQGKSGAYERVVHTPLGFAVHAHLLGAKAHLQREGSAS